MLKIILTLDVLMYFTLTSSFDHKIKMQTMFHLSIKMSPHRLEYDKMKAPS